MLLVEPKTAYPDYRKPAIPVVWLDICPVPIAVAAAKQGPVLDPRRLLSTFGAVHITYWRVSQLPTR